MISAREQGLAQLLIFSQILAVFLLYWALYWAFFAIWEDAYPPIQNYSKYSIVVSITMVFEAISRPSALKIRPGRVRQIGGSVSRRQLLWTSAAIMSLAVFSHDYVISRAFLMIFICSTFTLLFYFNRFGVPISNRIGARFLGDWRLRTALLGPKEWCDSIKSELNFNSGMLDLRATIHTDGYVHPETYLKEIPKNALDLLILPPRSIPSDIVIRLIREGDRKGFRCWLPVEYTRQYRRRFSIQKVGNLDILTPPIEPLENTSNRVIKRAFDLAFSLMICATLLPVTSLFVWVLHRLFSPGPLFFRQDRIGKNGQVFQIYKFRSLHVENSDESKQVSKQDNRVFTGGRLLRKTSIDEIPQFINVLRSEMSVVGPRPHMAAHDNQFSDLYEGYGRRRYVKPGITGLAQVKGFRGQVNSHFDLRHRARLDRFYVMHWALGLDTKILLMTFLSVIRPPKSAY